MDYRFAKRLRRDYRTLHMMNWVRKLNWMIYRIASCESINRINKRWYGF